MVKIAVLNVWVRVVRNVGQEQAQIKFDLMVISLHMATELIEGFVMILLS
jgi:hypothetical protein